MYGRVLHDSIVKPSHIMPQIVSTALCEQVVCSGLPPVARSRNLAQVQRRLFNLPEIRFRVGDSREVGLAPKSWHVFMLEPACDLSWVLYFVAFP
jgi:hypothetical protein